ncbi:GNAT family N-acetyltransferase [Actinokineospora sp. PR83]|uniref:GNAT family N-acetyltransferase n=1 Tax=Actinokineospora sp. PR83 TaxID=2884908 RepID=UPI0027DFF4EF|nr:GNAT family N-acetyltransferase [Actinokineospora sp. PR83]MCG8918809.1 GNAT family N-acetyltransferase [Actinokineospora sp. PR83]
MTGPLLAAQSTRFAGLDPLLPAAVAPPGGEALVAALPDGERVAAVLTRTEHGPGTAPALWSALDVRELHPLLGAAPGAALDVLLRRWAAVLARAAPGPDSSCVVTWPSRDVVASEALLAHGFVPLSVLAVRVGPAPGTRPSAVTVRRATAADLDFLVDSAVAEVEYSSRVGGAVLRPRARAVKRAALRVHLAQEDPVWLAERGGEPVGHAEGWQTVSAPGSWAETRVRHGRWGYLNCLSVVPSARGTGVGRALADAAHADLLSGGAVGMFLYYNPPNPLSPVFWSRQGYRPLWTVWELRPATALR